MGSKGRGAGASRSPRKARKVGTGLGGLSEGLEQRNFDAQMYALQAALEFRYVLEDGEDKTLAALAEDLFAAGCRTKGGKPITPKMVERMRKRLVKSRNTCPKPRFSHVVSPLRMLESQPAKKSICSPLDFEDGTKGARSQLRQ